MAGRCRPGDVLGLVEGEVQPDRRRPRRRPAPTLLDRMLGGGGELVTLVARRATPRPGWPTRSREHVARALAVRRGPGLRRAGSRTTRCWWGSSDVRATLDTPLAKAAWSGRRPRRRWTKALRPAHRRRPALPLPAPLRRARRAHRHRASLDVGEQVTVLAQVQRRRRPADAAAGRGSMLEVDRRRRLGRRADADVLQPGRGASASCARAGGACSPARSTEFQRQAPAQQPGVRAARRRRRRPTRRSRSSPAR